MSYTTKTTIIAFDLHGVVSSSDYWQILKLGLRYPGSILRLGLYSFNPFFLRKVYRLWRSHKVAAAYLQMVETDYPFLKPTIDFLIQVGNAQQANKPLIAFIKQLQARGYQVHLFSNIGDLILDDLVAKQPALINLFDAICYTHARTGYVGKPYDAAFHAYHAQCNPMGKQVIFVDNTKRNIAAAERHGMIGVLYTDADNVITTLTNLLTITRNS